MINEESVPTTVIKTEFKRACVILLDANTYLIVLNVKCFGKRRNALSRTSLAEANVHAKICQNGRNDISVINPKII